MPYINHNQFIILKSFIETNLLFIHLLERLKFEGYNGFPNLYELVYHSMYESMYVKELLERVEYCECDDEVESVLIQAKFRDMGFGDDILDCIYSQMYFWSLIGAQHPSILMNVTPEEQSMLPKDTVKKFMYFVNKFNECNFKLSSIYAKLNKNDLHREYVIFKELNKQFLEFLKSFEMNEEYLPKEVKETLPEIFFGVWQHIIDEHTYVLNFCNKVDEYMKW